MNFQSSFGLSLDVVSSHDKEIRELLCNLTPYMIDKINSYLSENDIGINDIDLATIKRAMRSKRRK